MEPRDVTARSRALTPIDETLLLTQQPEEFETARVLRSLLENIDGMVYRCRGDRDWTMEFVSRGAMRLTGHTAAELLLNRQVCYQQLILPEDRSRIRREARAALLSRTTFDIQYRIRHQNGTQRWVWDRGAGVYDDAGTLLAIEGIVQDISDHKSLDLSLREAERRYQSLFENAIEGIFRTTPEGHYLDANPALARIYGFDSPQELMQSLKDIRRQLYVDAGRRDEFMRIVKARGFISGFESRVYRKSGEVIWISENARAVLDDAAQVLYYEGTVEDITERKLYEARIERQANYDNLTGLANRSLLNDRLQQAILAASTAHTRLAVAFVDLDRFKYINDSLGHQAGDQLLGVVAQRLKSCVNELDTVARVGGDEFVLLLNSVGESDTVASTIERCLTLLAEPWHSPHGPLEMTCSIGVALYPNDGHNAETLLKHADSAMYRAKESGRNNFQFFTSELNVLMAERLELESGLRHALEREQFELYYQPRIDMRSGRLVGAEALLRWRTSPTHIIEPARFIPVAEETGLIIPIGQWVLRTACLQSRSWLQAGLLPFVMSVNISPCQFQRDDLVQVIADTLRDTGLAPAQLEIELTENVAMHNAQQLTGMLSDIKALGVQIAVDDFGTGYSSLSYLQRFPVDRLKIDRSFIKDINTDKGGRAIVRAIIALGHNLGLRVVAEGVEQQSEIEYLRDNGCDELQGFYFGRPMPAAEFERFLRQQRPHDEQRCS